jgi:hypothetical protein
MELSTSQQFEQERLSRLIDQTADVGQLRTMAKMLLEAWMVQKAAALWAMRESLPKARVAATVTPWDDPLA